ncbi:MAG: hypothetical protein ACR2JB_27840 [Bryobacteraceae bacterium]
MSQQVRAAKKELHSLLAEVQRKEDEVNQYERTLALVHANSNELIPDGIKDRWQAFEHFCKLHRSDGFTRPQLLRFLKGRYIECGKNFAYQAVKKWEG